MANTTDPLARSIHGTNPQNLIEKIMRGRIYNSMYWKEDCFGLTAETLIDKAMTLEYIGGCIGGHQQPTPFICLVLKMLQIQPEEEIVLEFVKNEDYKYIRILGAFYLRLTGRNIDIYKYLEPLYNDYRKIRVRKTAGWEIMHIDELVDRLLREELFCDVTLPTIPKRHVLEDNDLLAPRRSVLQDEIEEMAAQRAKDEEDLGNTIEEKRLSKEIECSKDSPEKEKDEEVSSKREGSSKKDDKPNEKSSEDTSNSRKERESSPRRDRGRRNEDWNQSSKGRRSPSPASRKSRRSRSGSRDRRKYSRRRSSPQDRRSRRRSSKSRSRSRDRRSSSRSRRSSRDSPQRRRKSSDRRSRRSESRGRDRRSSQRRRSYSRSHSRGRSRRHHRYSSSSSSRSTSRSRASRSSDRARHHSRSDRQQSMDKNDEKHKSERSASDHDLPKEDAQKKKKKKDKEKKYSALFKKTPAEKDDAGPEKGEGAGDKDSVEHWNSVRAKLGLQPLRS